MTSDKADVIRTVIELHDAFSVLENELFDNPECDDAGIRYVNGKWQVYVFYHGEDDEV